MKILNQTKDAAIAKIEEMLAEVKKDTPVITDSDNEGLASLMGQTITVFCAVYIYTGKLVGVNTTCIKLENTKIVYETGAFTDKNWKDAQVLTNKYHYISTHLIESFGIIK